MVVQTLIFWRKKSEKEFLVYLACDHETTEKVPKCIEWSSNYRSHNVIGSDCDGHHAEESEVQ